MVWCTTYRKKVLVGDVGSRLLLGDVVEVHDTYEEDDVIVRFNGQLALGMEAPDRAY